MPEIDPFSTVYRGMEGTGAAAIFSGNQAADIFNQQLSIQQQQRRMDEMQRQKAMQAEKELVDKDLASINPEDYWLPHADEILADHDALMKEGARIYAETGVKPYNNPEWSGKVNKLYAKAKYSADIKRGFNDLQKELSINGDKYSDESIAAVKAFYDPKKPISQYQKDGYVPPQLQPRYTLSGMLKNVKGSFTEDSVNGQIIKKADRGKNLKQVLALQDTPAFENFVKEAGGDPSIGPFLTPHAQQLYSIKDEDLLPIADDILARMEPSEYQKQGLTSTTPEEARMEILGKMKTNNAAYDRVLQAGADALDSQVDGGSKKDWSADASARGWANIKLSKQRLANSVAKQNKNDEESASIIIGNSDSFTPVLKKGSADPVIEKGSSLMSANFDNQEITIQPSRIINTKTGSGKANTQAINMKVGGVRLVPVQKGVRDEFNDVELSERQLKEIIAGKHKTLKLRNVTFKPLAYGTRKVVDKNGNSVEESISVPYNAISGNEKLKTKAFDKAYSQFNELINSEEFKSLSDTDKYEFLKQQFNLK